MVVKNCKKCEHCVRRVWLQYHKPNNYHAIGMSHAYAFCAKHGKRVLDVKNCKEADK